MSHQIKVLHVLDHSIPLHSGYTFRTKSILEQQRILGWETSHITSSKQGETESDFEEVDGLSFYRTKASSGLLSRLPILNQYAVVLDLKERLNSIIDQIKPDIIHAHSPSLNGLAAVRIGKKKNIPVVYEIRAFWEDAAVDHGTTTEGSLRYRITKMLETNVVKRANAVTTICEGLRQDLINRGISQEKITIIPNAVNAENFSFKEEPDLNLKNHLGLEGKDVLGFIGSFYAYEGLDLVVSAMPELIKNNRNIHLLLVGGGPQEENLKQMVDQLGISSNVTFTGRVPHNEVQRYYGIVDLLVYARHKMRLTDLVTPLKPLEAMAQGQIFLASDVGGHKELIKDKETGYLFKSGDISDLITNINYALSDKSNWSKIQRAGRDYVENERNWKNSVSRYEKIYLGLIDKKKGK